MNKLILILLLLFVKFAYSQTIYTFGTPGSYPNPGWVSLSNQTPANRVLNYQTNATFVSTNDFPAGNRYVNNQLTSYTSPIINTICSNASTVNVIMQIGVDLDNRFDWVYFQYSLNGGATWNNPVALYPQTNLSGVNMSAYAPLTIAGTGNNRNGWTGSINNTFTYVIPTSANTMFRYIFESDGIVNSYTIGFTTYDYYFDIYRFDVVCNVQLPVELLYFEADKDEAGNILQWKTETETNNDYFEIEWTADPTDSNSWVKIATVDSKGGGVYNFLHDKYKRNDLNYYRLSQTDENGTRKELGIDVVDNSFKYKEILKVVNSLGQMVDLNTKGVIFIIYTNGQMERVVNY